MIEQPVIHLEAVRFRWPDAATECLSIDRLEVQAGRHVFLYGPSGSGKSTLLGILGGVLVAESGSVNVLGESLERLRPAARDRFRADHIGFIFQQFNLLPYLSVLDNVLLPCRFSRSRADRALSGGGTLRDEGLRLLARLGMSVEICNRPATRLSVGQQQRVAAARALIGRPGLVIADEPTSALDADLQRAFVDLLLHEAAEAKATVIFVSHDHRLAGRFPCELALPTINSAALVGEGA